MSQVWFLMVFLYDLFADTKQPYKLTPDGLRYVLPSMISLELTVVPLANDDSLLLCHGVRMDDKLVLVPQV